MDFGKNTRQVPNVDYADELIAFLICPSDSSARERVTSGTKHANEFMGTAPATTTRSYMGSHTVFDCSKGLSPNGY